MTDEEKLRQRIARATALKEWADGPDGLFAIIDGVRATYLGEIAGSEPTESAFREAAYHRVKALADLRRAFEVIVAEGNGSAARLADLMKRKEKHAA